MGEGLSGAGRADGKDDGKGRRLPAGNSFAGSRLKLIWLPSTQELYGA
jgi:hypothetical protein